jgi:signal peptidase I
MEKKTSQKKTTVREYAESLISALVLALIVLTFIGRAFEIPSSSMFPTLQIGDRIFVNRFAYKLSVPKRGDVAVFIYPMNEKRDFVKRIIGLPGETVEIENGHILINGKPANNPSPLTFNTYYNTGGYGTQQVRVPEGEYFVLGDNSGNSKDSRYWGFVPSENLKGKAFAIYWPPRRIRRLR